MQFSKEEEMTAELNMSEYVPSRSTFFAISSTPRVIGRKSQNMRN